MRQGRADSVSAGGGAGAGGVVFAAPPYFKVSIGHFRATGLHMPENLDESWEVDNYRNINPFLKCNFADVKQFRTHVLRNDRNPVWHAHEPMAFHYEIQSTKELSKKHLTVECYTRALEKRPDRASLDASTAITDRLLGSCSVDLFTIATGPVDHDLPIKIDDEVVGRLLFSVTMEQNCDLSLVLRDIIVTGLTAKPGVDTNPYMEISHSNTAAESRKRKHVRLPTLINNLNPMWREEHVISFPSNYQDIMKTGLFVEVRNDLHRNVNTVLGVAGIPLSKYFTTDRSRLVTFQEDLYIDSQPVASVQGTMTWLNPPDHVQMTGGTQTETGIIGGRLPPTAGLLKPNAVIWDPVSAARRRYYATLVSADPEYKALIPVTEKLEPSAKQTTEQLLNQTRKRYERAMWTTQMPRDAVFMPSQLRERLQSAAAYENNLLKRPSTKNLAEYVDIYLNTRSAENATKTLIDDPRFANPPVVSFPTAERFQEPITSTSIGPGEYSSFDSLNRAYQTRRTGTSFGSHSKSKRPASAPPGSRSSSATGNRPTSAASQRPDTPFYLAHGNMGGRAARITGKPKDPKRSDTPAPGAYNNAVVDSTGTVARTGRTSPAFTMRARTPLTQTGHTTVGPAPPTINIRRYLD